MPEISSAIRPSSGGHPARVRLGSDGRSFRVRSAATNNPKYLPKKPNPRAQDRRRRDLIEAFLAALGGEDAVSPVVLMHVRRAAELLTMAEMARADMLNGVSVDMLALVRLEGAAARAARLLGIKVGPAAKTSRALEVARPRWKEQRAQEQAKKAKAEAGEATSKDAAR